MAYYFAELLKEIKKNIAESEMRVVAVLRKVTEEVLAVEAEIRDVKKMMATQITSTQILPFMPFDSIEKFKAFEDDLVDNNEKMRPLVSKVMFIA